MDEVWSSSEAEEDPIDDSKVEEVEEEEEEDPCSSDGYGSGEEEVDKDLSPPSAHRPVIRSTPKKPVSRPKRKAYRSKGSRPRGSSRKQSKGQR